MNKEQILEKITTFFCKSNDFNGMPLTNICEEICEKCAGELDEVDVKSASPEFLMKFSNPCKGSEKAAENIKQIVGELVNEDKVVIVYDLNPHVMRFPPRTKADQKKFLNENFAEVCAYPTKSEVAKYIDFEKYKDSPYLKKMWECGSNLEPIYFDLEILENYSNDPRYIFNWGHYTGSIHLSDDYYESLDMKPRDQTYLEHFGLGFRKSDGHRVASVPLIYLSRLTPEHQQRWKTHEEEAPCFMDPDYYTTSIIGNWAEDVPIYDAFIYEIEVINQMCSAANLPNLFRESFKNNRPKYFRIPFRNTKEAYHTSVEEMDKMISQNLNKKFFESVLRADETYRTVKHKTSGKDAIEQLGTLALLNHWIKTRVKFNSKEDEVEVLTNLEAFDRVRKIRQSPAHKIEKDEHGRTFADLHDEILNSAYVGLRTIRLLFTNHPSIEKEVKVPDWLYKGKIRQFGWKGQSPKS
ncbi:MAG: hypothetical protein IPM57_03145 [Oligoflexia bacterium]|nr:hypothetical protein [Oligoflexia bacterium]